MHEVSLKCMGVEFRIGEINQSQRHTHKVAERYAPESEGVDGEEDEDFQREVHNSIMPEHRA